ncbi:DUF3577 domain-containing protein [Pseudomonas gingeri]|uniref:DUF3577 domain-containing protein n=1 Tax=Pseudomonas gingeri TaxID=117681 RepID=UPI0015A347FB|nr:DUF3577 domain-containing protein [Pseudomonas gingeri]NWA25595.1 DUF3577 domain-containing protein [Pseudomonas gingeri]
MSESTAEEKKYFNQHIRGFAYLSNARTIDPPKGDAYQLVRVSALHGAADDCSYTDYDCRVIGTVAKELIKKCAKAINSGETVFVRFLLSGLWVVPYIYQQGEKQGQPGASLRANLLSMSMMMINGDVVYTAPVEEENAGSAPSAAADDVGSADHPHVSDAPDVSGESGHTGHSPDAQSAA